MANLSLANQILAGQAMDPRPVNANFVDIETFINDEVFTVDGAKALTSALTLAGAGTADGHAVNKAQLDAEAATAAAATAAAVTKAEDELTVSLVDAEAAWESDATTKADAALAAAKVYSDAAKIETDYASDNAGGSITTNSDTAQTFLDTGNFTNTKAGHYIVTATVDVSVNTVAAGPALNAFVGQLKVDGVVQTQQMVWDPFPATVGDRVTLNQTWIVPATAGDTLDFKLLVTQAEGNFGSYTCDGSNHSYLHALFVG